MFYLPSYTENSPKLYSATGRWKSLDSSGWFAVLFVSSTQAPDIVCWINLHKYLPNTQHNSVKRLLCASWLQLRLTHGIEMCHKLLKIWLSRYLLDAVRCDEHSDRLAITGRINEQCNVMHECGCKACLFVCKDAPGEKMGRFKRMKWADRGSEANESLLLPNLQPAL